MSTDTSSKPLSPAESGRVYPAYSQPLWQRLLLTRETAVIALLVAVLLWAIYGVLYFGTQLTMTYLFLDTAPDPADRAADGPGDRDR